MPDWTKLVYAILITIAFIGLVFAGALLMATVHWVGIAFLTIIGAFLFIIIVCVVYMYLDGGTYDY